MTKNFIRAVEQALLPLADAERAPAMTAYMKHHFTYLGIATPERRAVCKPLIKAFDGDPLAAAQALWRKTQREYQYVACDLLRQHAKHLDGSALPALEELVQSKSWWDSVDGLAPIFGEIVLRERKLAKRMDTLIKAENFWLRRIALLHQLGWKEETDEDRLFRYCLLCADEQEFFIRKAIGWALRQHARVAPQSVQNFVKTHRDRLSGLSVREALKHL